MKLRPFLGCAVLFGGACLASAALADYELVMFTPEHFGAAPLCCAGCDELPNTIQDGQHFDNAFGSYDRKKHWTNTAVDGRDFSETAWVPWGADSTDPGGTDWADVIFYSGHGTRVCSAFAGWWSEIAMGDDNSPPSGTEDCKPHTAFRPGSTNGHVRLGGDTPNEDANAYVLFACQSAHKCVWENGGYSPMDRGQFNIMNGFHGIVWEASGYQDDLEDYAKDAKWNDIGDAWLDEMYRYRLAGKNNCPVSILWGANESEIDEFYDDAGWFDFHDVGAHSTSGFYFLDGCNPKDGEKL